MTDTLRITGRYPPTIQQRATIGRLNSDSHADVSYVMRLAFLVTPSVDLRRLERTFAKLTARHDTLRQSFEVKGGEWFVNIWNRHRTGLLVEDHGDLSDPDFRALVDHHSSVQIKLLDDVLFQIVVLRCGARGDVLFIRCHHGNIDGHSMIILVEDWLNLLIGIPLRGKGVTHEEYLSEFSNSSPIQKIESQKYWNELLFPVLPNPGLGKFGKPGERPRLVYRTDTVRAVSRSLTRVEFDGIPVAVNARSQTPFSIVTAAFADTLIEMTELPGVYVQTIVDRTSSGLRNYVGCAVSWPPIRCDAANGMSLPDYTSQLALQFKQSLAHLPNEAAAFELDVDHAVYKYGGLLRHFSCNVTATDGRVKKSPFSNGSMPGSETPRKIGPLTIARLKIEAQNHDFHGLRLRIIPYVDQTILLFKYHSHFYTEKDMEALLSGMQDRLQIQLA